MTIAEIILSIITLLLGGTNIVTFVTLRSLKRKGNYEADGAGIANLQTVIDLQGSEIKRLSERLTAAEKKNEEDREKYEARIARLQEQYDSLVSALRTSGMKIAPIA